MHWAVARARSSECILRDQCARLTSFAGLRNDAGRVLLRETDDASHAAVADAPFGVKHPLAKRLGLRPYAIGSR
jgi:hypothetical protein